MTIYCFKIFGVQYVDAGVLGLMKRVAPWFKKRTAEAVSCGQFFSVKTDRGVDEHIAWRIARDLDICPWCGEKIFRSFQDTDVVYACDCGYNERMDIS